MKLLMLLSLCMVMAVSYIVVPISGLPNPDPAPAPFEPVITAAILTGTVTLVNGALSANDGAGYEAIFSVFEDKTDYSCAEWIHAVTSAVKWSPVRDACIRGNNYKHFPGVETIDKCKEKCLTHLGYGCESIDYETSPVNCWISKARSDNNKEFTEPCYDRTQTKFTEIIHDNGNRPETRCWEHNRKGTSRTYYGCNKRLQDTEMNDKITSCEQKGVWVYYGDHFDDDVHVQITPGYLNDGYFNVVPENNDKWSSLRYAGIDDTTTPSWTLYEHGWFQGDKTYVGIDSVDTLGGLNNKAGSLITIGSTDWTFYDNANYGGQCFTVRGGSSNSGYGSTAAVLISLHQLDMNDKISSVKVGKDSRCNYIDPIYIGPSGGYSQNNT